VPVNTLSPYAAESMRRSSSPSEAPSLLARTPGQASPIPLNPDHGLLQQVAVVGLWGALEGFFTLVLDFLRKKRPQ
jgi:hypothetical protein